MTNKRLKEIREYVSCPQLGDDHYGDWGILTLEQRRTIVDLIEMVKSRDELINRQFAELINLENLLNDETILALRGVVYGCSTNRKCENGYFPVNIKNPDKMQMMGFDECINKSSIFIQKLIDFKRGNNT